MSTLRSTNFSPGRTDPQRRTPGLSTAEMVWNSSVKQYDKEDQEQLRVPRGASAAPCFSSKSFLIIQGHVVICGLHVFELLHNKKLKPNDSDPINIDLELVIRDKY